MSTFVREGRIKYVVIEGGCYVTHEESAQDDVIIVLWISYATMNLDKVPECM